MSKTTDKTNKDSLIYILDDEKNVLELIEQNITLKGIGKTVCFDNSPAFYKAIETQLPDIILLDIKMPDANGIDICINLKSQARTKDIPVIFISVANDTETIVKGFDAGAVDYISKPFITKEMAARITTHLKLKKGNEELKFTNEKLQNMAEEFQATNEELHTTAYELKLSNEDLIKTNIELKKSTENLKLSLDSSNAGTWDWDIVNNEFYWSDEFLKIFGIDRTVKPGFEEWSKALYPEDIETASKRIKEAIDENKELFNDYRIILPTKEIRWIRATGKTFYDDNNNPLRMTGLCMDITELKQAENALLDRENKLRMITDNVPAYIAYVDAGLHYRFVNKNYELLFSKPHTNIINKNIREVAGDAYYDNVLNKIQDVLSGQKIFFETTLPYKDKNLFLSAAYIPDTDENGVTNGFYVLAYDITERKQSEEKIKELLEFNQIIIDTSLIGILTYKASGQCVQVNRAITTIIGGKEEELLSQNFKHIKSWEKSGMLQLAEEALISGKKVGREIQTVTTFGKEVWYDAQFIPFNIKNESHLLVMLSDIKERKQAEQKIIESEKKYRMLVENLNEGIWQIDKDAYTVFVNPRMAEMLGYTVEEMMGKQLFDFMDEQGGQITKQNIERRKQGIKEQHDFEFMRKDGVRIYTHIETSPIVDDNGNYQGAIAGVMDITERKQLQQQLIQSEKLAAVGQLAAGIAHEFNNVLAMVYSNIQVLELAERNPETLGSFETIKYAVKRGAAIALNMMNFAKPKIPKRELSKIEDVIEVILNLQKQQLILEHIDISRNYQETEKVLIDSGQLQQVFLNMIINARHAILPKHKGKISISVRAVDKNIEIKIMDDGVGIDKEDLTNIFIPFFSTKGAWAKNNHGIDGTGLGLAVSYTIIKNHNGTIRVESEKDKGTVFTIELPMPERQIELIEKETDKVTSCKTDNRTLNILVVDDEAHLILIMTKMFEISNCKVLSSVSGIGGVKLAKENKFDIIFLDMLLPDISGEKMFTEIRKFNKEVPIIFISGQIGLETEKLKALGAYGFIQKPFSMDDLEKILNEIRKKK